MSVLGNEISGCVNSYQLLSSAKRWAGNAEMSFEIWYHILDHVANVDENSMFREICVRMLETYYNDENGFPLLLTQALYHCINTDTISLEWRQRAIRVLIQCLNFNLGDVGIVKRCLLTLSLFDLPRKGFKNDKVEISVTDLTVFVTVTMKLSPILRRHGLEPIKVILFRFYRMRPERFLIF